MFTRDYSVMSGGILYLKFIWPSYLFLAVKTVWARTSIATGNTGLPMAAAIVSIFLNTVLNYLLIFGFRGIPALGAAGAAIATSISSGIECLILIVVSYIKKLPSALRPVYIKGFAPGFLKVAMPVIMGDGLWALAQTAYAMIYGVMGTETVAALSISGTLDNFMHTFTAGIVGAGSVMVGMALGGEKLHEAYQIAVKVLKWVAVSGAFSAAIVISSRNIVSGLFNVPPDIRRIGAQLILIVGLSIPLEAVNWCLWSGILRSGGDTDFNMVVETATIWLLGVPLAAFSGLYLGWPIQWVIVLTYTDEIVKAIWGLLRFRSRRWVKHISV
jgi:putative MATE family efflux protein